MQHREARIIPAERNTNIVTPVKISKEAAGEGPSSLVVIYGPLLARRWTLEKDEVTVGRSEDADIRFDDDAVSRIHARFVVGEGRVRLVDLDSTNGTLVNEKAIHECELRDGDLVQIGETIFKFLSGANVESKYHQEMYKITTVDGLTKAYNRRYFSETLEREILRAKRYRRELCLAMLDIDLFKNVNDTWGHLAGDSVLRELARIINEEIRREDVFARYGGEEFALLLPEVGLGGARMLCERLRKSIAEAAFVFGSETIPVSVSFGIASTAGIEEIVTAVQLIALADDQLYEAKRLGRNRVCG